MALVPSRADLHQVPCLALLVCSHMQDIRFLASHGLLPHTLLYFVSLRMLLMLVLPATITLALQAGKPAASSSTKAPGAAPFTPHQSGINLTAATAAAAAVGLESGSEYENPLPLVPSSIYLRFHRLAEAIHARADPHVRNLAVYFVSGSIMAVTVGRLEQFTDAKQLHRMSYARVLCPQECHVRLHLPLW